ncbi:nitrogen regulatory protein P-II family [Ruegeria marina]|uniref:Nitrogen regulatory protein P-II n=1 Tax=Ruegeria marina TaxID=639004 RepID=A0A1G6WZS5_9RHOB|nr:nitrogen regulatory protein P-II family [Ruegeria marina]
MDFLCKICALTLVCWPKIRAKPFAEKVIPVFLRMQNAGSTGGTKGKDVKLIIATIKPFKLEEVRQALTDAGVRGMMVTEIKGFGAQSGHTEIYRGAEYTVNFVPKIKLELVVSDQVVDQIVETIAATARTGKIGDGKIFVLDVAQALRVRTGESDEDAL